MSKVYRLLVLFVFLFGSWVVQPAGADGLYRLRFASEPKPALYLQFQGNNLRIASTREGLATAKPIPGRISQGGGNYRPTIFPQQKLPLAKGPETKARFLLTGNVLRADYDVIKKDGAGNTWHFLLHSGLPQPETMVLPDLEALSLQVKTEIIEFEGERIVGKNLGIGLVLQAGEQTIDNVRKNERSADCRLRVIDPEGKVFASARGGLEEKFGFG